MTDDPSNSVYTAPSRIHGTGVFAARAYRAGERIHRRNIARDVTADAPLRADLGEFEHHQDWLGGGRVVLLGVPDRYLNHCCEPNSYVREIDGVQYIYAYRDIAEDEELTNDYSTAGGGDTVWHCNCGALTCRRTMHSDYFHLPLLKQVEYLPLQPQWFFDERRAEFDALRARMRELNIDEPPAPGAEDAPANAGRPSPAVIAGATRLIDPTRELTEETARRLVDTLERTGAMTSIRRIRGNQVASAIIGAIGLALFIVGVENAAADIPVISNAWGSIVAGLILLAVTGALLTRLRGH
jgi:hypothetical protein